MSSIFRNVPRTGVIFVMTEASKKGYTPHNSDWANLGQGAPEVGELESAPPRIKSIKVGDVEYTAVDGLPELKQSVATLYNQRYGRNYSKDNVSICAGGRLALTRLVSTLGRVNVGHFLPDYTAYEELLETFGTFVPIPILLNPKSGYKFSADDLEQEILGRGLSAVILSNPSNPTGKLIQGEELSKWVAVARNTGCNLIIDEFYSHYIYGGENGQTISAAKYITDEENDPIIILDGLTKNWRYPGMRVAWTVAPKKVIEGVASAGSFLDGGCSRPIQEVAVDLIKRESADQEARALQKEFTKKRELILKRLKEIGIVVDAPPDGAFYCWGDISKLPTGINNGMDFFKAALEEKVVVVPGQFFDINPGHRRSVTRFSSYIRFSFGPNIVELNRGLDGLERLINKNLA